MRRVIQITITVFEKKTADILIVLARLPYNKPAYLSINLDTVRAQYTFPRIHNPPFLSPAWLLSRRKRRGNISLAKPLPILHCPWRSAILPFHLAHLIFFFFFLIQTYRGTRDLPETKRWHDEGTERFQSWFLGEIFLMDWRRDEIFETNGKILSQYLSRLFPRAYVLPGFYYRSYVSINSKFTRDVLITHLCYAICNIFSFVYSR